MDATAVDALGRPRIIEAGCSDETGAILARAAAGEFRIQVMGAGKANGAWWFEVLWPPPGGWSERNESYEKRSDDAARASSAAPGAADVRGRPELEMPEELPNWA